MSMTMTTTRAWTDSALGGRSTVNIESPVQSIESTINCSDVLAVAAWNDQLDAQLYPASLVDRAVTPVWYAVGIVGNVLSAIIWLQRRMLRNNSSAVYLATLSINDTLFLLLHILLDLDQAWGVQTLDFQVVCETFSFFILVTQYLAPTLVLGFTVERFIAVCYPYQKIHFCTTSRAVKVVAGMIVGCSLLGSIQPYLWAYNRAEDKCALRPGLEALWEVWSWTTEMVVFLLVPLVILIVNVLVMREVWRMSSSGPVAPSQSIKTRSEGSRHSSVHSAESTKNAATNAMLLTVSFYVIFTTLPATLVYVLANVYPEVRPAFHGGQCDVNTTTTSAATPTSVTGAAELATDEVYEDQMRSWRRYVVYMTVRSVVYEVCLSHYACNFFFYIVTGREFRSALARLCRGAGGSHSTTVTAINRTNSAENGGGGMRAARAANRFSTPQLTQAPTATPGAANEQRTLLARI